MEHLEITVVGAGVVGLAVACELSKSRQDVFLVEQESSWGRGVSSRNSEVIHAGLYYPRDSLKTRACVEGRALLYEYCARHNLAHKKTGKLVVATNDLEAADAQKLFARGLENGVGDLEMLSQEEIKKIEPNVRALAALYSPSTGIIDTHALMQSLASEFQSRGGTIACNTRVEAIEKIAGGYLVTVKDSMQETYSFSTRILVNSAGLHADAVAAMAGVALPEYRIKYCKGDYVRVHPGKARLLNGLVYPVPKKAGAGLGIHATLDMAGGMRLGPDDEYVAVLEYAVAPSKVKVFYDNVRSFLPFIELADLTVDMAGIRPKLQGPGEDFRDFVIKHEIDAGFPGLVNLIGIESPGLTGSLFIARMVQAGIKGLL